MSFDVWAALLPRRPLRGCVVCGCADCVITGGSPAAKDGHAGLDSWTKWVARMRAGGYDPGRVRAMVRTRKGAPR